MSSSAEPSCRRIPSLANLCQRVCSAHVDSICSFGNLRYDLIKPILESCSAENLVRLEYASPHIRKDTPEIWKDMCFRSYPLPAERYLLGDTPEPESWRDQYFILREAEAKRLEEIGSRIRSQRLEADERKKEREVKMTDRVLPLKRPRTGWSATPNPPKTLFQKTLTEASRIQRNMYSAPMVPPMSRGKDYRVLSKPSSDQTHLPTPSASSGSRVTVKTVLYRRPSMSLPAPVASPPRSSISVSATSTKKSALPSNLPSTKDNPSPKPLPLPPSKKDPMATLFMPKHRTFSQLRSQEISRRAVPSR